MDEKDALDLGLPPESKPRGAAGRRSPKVVAPSDSAAANFDTRALLHKLQIQQCNELAAANQMLRSEIAARKQAEEALLHAKEAAEAANAAKSLFLANMSHELRTPMNAILGMIDMALPKTPDPVVQDYLQTAKESADLLLALLNDLLDSAKIESGKMELESAPFSLRRMMDQIAHVLSLRASEHGLCFSCRVPDGTPDVVVGDRMKLQQVLINLTGNAIKFTEHGDVEVRVRTATVPREGWSAAAPAREDLADLEFSVRDSGIGIPPAVRQHLFHPFTQADPSMARRFGGTGLGLSICKGLVEMMGGRIWVESEMGKGSTFYFSVRLPVAKEVVAGAEAPAIAATCTPLRILLVEDNPANQKLAVYVLQDRGHAIEIAGNGHEAVYLAEHNRYDVILMDVQMPEMNGLEATAAIRRREAGRRPTPIVAMTAYAMKGDRERCLKAGMNAYISKPVRRDELIKVVEGLASDGDLQSHGASLGLQAGPGVSEHQARSPKPQHIALQSSPGNPPPSLPPFNLDEALDRLGGEQELFRQMVRFFFSDGLKLLAEIRAAAATGDVTAVEKKAHRLKGTLLYLGADSATDAVAAVEALGRSADLTGVALAIRSMESEVTRLAQALRPYALAAG